MTRHSRKRKKKVNKRQRLSATASPSTRTAKSTLLPPGVGKLDPDRTEIITKQIFIEAPAKFCFDTLSKQLEHPPQWDPMIVNAWPASDVRGRIGAVSQLVLNLGGKRLNSRVLISRYRPNGAISWVLSEKPKVREDWKLEPKRSGTLVRLNFAQELNGSTIGRLIYKAIRWKKVEQDLDRMLAQLKETVESTKL